MNIQNTLIIDLMNELKRQAEFKNDTYSWLRLESILNIFLNQLKEIEKVSHSPRK